MLAIGLQELGKVDLYSEMGRQSEVYIYISETSQEGHMDANWHLWLTVRENVGMVCVGGISLISLLSHLGEWKCRLKAGLFPIAWLDCQ